MRGQDILGCGHAHIGGVAIDRHDALGVRAVFCNTLHDAVFAADGLLRGSLRQNGVLAVSVGAEGLGHPLAAGGAVSLAHFKFCDVHVAGCVSVFGCVRDDGDAGGLGLGDDALQRLGINRDDDDDINALRDEVFQSRDLCCGIRFAVGNNRLYVRRVSCISQGIGDVCKEVVGEIHGAEANRDLLVSSIRCSGFLCRLVSRSSLRGRVRVLFRGSRLGRTCCQSEHHEGCQNKSNYFFHFGSS